MLEFIQLKRPDRFLMVNAIHEICAVDVIRAIDAGQTKAQVLNCKTDEKTEMASRRTE